MKYKVGDKFTYSKAQPGYFDGVLTVQSGEVMYTATHSLSGLGGFFENDMVPYVDPMTDQQLADKYRELREEALLIARQMVQRGFKLEVSVDGGDWFGTEKPSKSYDFRFTKTQTINTVL